jgi:hypothetical protein
VEIFGWNFSAKNYSSREFISLSSAALVNAARTVQTARESSVPAGHDSFGNPNNHKSKSQTASSSERIFPTEKPKCGNQIFSRASPMPQPELLLGVILNEAVLQAEGRACPEQAKRAEGISRAPGLSHKPNCSATTPTSRLLVMPPLIYTFGLS